MVAIQLFSLYLALGFGLIVLGYALKKLIVPIIGSLFLMLAGVSLIGGLTYLNPTVASVIVSTVAGNVTTSAYTWTTLAVTENNVFIAGVGIGLVMLGVFFFFIPIFEVRAEARRKKQGER